MYLVDNEGWLRDSCDGDSICYRASPNCNQRPSAAAVDLLVIHNTSLPSGQFGGGHIEALFCNCLDCESDPVFADLLGLEVSAHLLIDRAGAITQFVSLYDRAWHAGVSCFEGRSNCNDFSIGIELEGTDTQPYTDAQYEQLARVTRALCDHFPALSPERIVGHSDIAPSRKTDPGPAFDWVRYRQQLHDLNNN
ncbi:MAG TPA: 1,6-anhydro-N-acetylmuramyl-L-alanine amidase AmpD [Spongiibacteraceae bacterium]|nr:1,6-anhydro-N-acetylmuramyl-L-alanine amidase AmpD [Spongiibacteraceae bacterium]